MLADARLLPEIWRVVANIHVSCMRSAVRLSYMFCTCFWYIFCGLLSAVSLSDVFVSCLCRWLLLRVWRSHIVVSYMLHDFKILFVYTSRRVALDRFRSLWSMHNQLNKETDLWNTVCSCVSYSPSLCKSVCIREKLQAPTRLRTAPTRMGR